MNPWRSLRGLPRSMWALAAATLVNRAGSMALAFFALYLTKARGLSPKLAGAVIAAYGVTALVVSPIAGRLSDRVGARRFAIGTLAVSGAMLMIFPLATTLGAILVMTVLSACATEAFRPANMALVGELTPPELRKQAFALSRLAVNLGMTIGPAMGGLLATRWFEGIFIIDGVTSIAAAGMMAATLKGPAKSQAPGSTPSGDTGVLPGPATRVGGPAHADARYLLFLAALLLTAMVFFQLDAAVPLYLVNHLGLPESAFGLLMAVNTVLVITIEVPLTGVIERWPARRAMALGALLVGVGFSANGLAHDFWQAAGAVVIWTFGEMILFPSSSAYVSELSPSGRSGEYMGLYTMTFGLGFTVGPWAGVAVMEAYGAPALWLVVLAAGLASAATFAFVKAPSDGGRARSAGTPDDREAHLP